MSTDRVFVDIETKCALDLKKCGVHAYARDPSFGIQLISFKLNDGEIITIDLTDPNQNPVDVLVFLKLLGDERVKKYAFNAEFEWACLNAGGYTTPINQWYDTQAHALYLTRPASLENCGKVLELTQEQRKASTLTALVKYFSQPRKDGTFNDPQVNKERYAEYIRYNRQDVEAEYQIQLRCDPFPMPESEDDLWRRTVLMNFRGIPIDRELVAGAIYIDKMCDEELLNEAKTITGLSNPNSTTQLLPWLADHGCPMGDLRKGTVEKMLTTNLDSNAHRVLEIRQQLSKTSVKKYQAMQDMLCDDDRARGVTKHLGASRTGRFASRSIQVQNMSRNTVPAMDVARELIKAGDYQTLKLIYGDAKKPLSACTRTAITAPDGYKLAAADLSAIEARVSAYEAGEEWKLDVFRTHGKIYEATASRMFGVPMESIAKGRENYSLRQKGKIAELALGYQGGVAAMKAMGGEEQGLTEQEMSDTVTLWRASNPRIVAAWKEVESAAVSVVQYGGSQKVLNGLYTFALETDVIYGQTFMTILMPVGRKLYYAKPFIKENRFGKPAVHYYEVGTTKKWEETSTYGGRLFENMTQAFARDCLVDILRRMEDRGYRTIFHVHDEIVVEVPLDADVDEPISIMREPISWAPGLPLNADGFDSPYYKKG